MRLPPRFIRADDKPARRNDGRPWQDEIVRIAKVYRDLRVMTLEKVDPPTKIVGRRVIFLPNPFPDFVGCWCERGRMIAVEAKSTSDGRLKIDVASGGLTRTQCEALGRWHAAGAISGVLWLDRGAAKWVSWPEVHSRVIDGHKSLRFEDGGIGIAPLPTGVGFVTRDFARVWRELRY